MAASRDYDDLAPVPTPICHRRRLPSRRQQRLPEQLPRFGVIGPEVAILRGSNEDHASPGRDRPADIGHAQREGEHGAEGGFGKGLETE